MRHLIVVLCLGSVSACATDEEVETIHDPCSPLTVAVASDISADELAGVEGAIRDWTRVLPVQIVVGTGAPAADVLPIVFHGGDAFRGIYWDGPGMIEIGRDQLDPADYAIAIAHELGHAFGLLHVSRDDRPSVMNLSNLDILPNAEDAAEVRALWAACR